MEELILDLKNKIVETLKLETRPEQIETDAPLFGEGLGLDSIDALELVAMLESKYDIRVEGMDKAIWQSPRTLAVFVQAQREGKSASGS